MPGGSPVPGGGKQSGAGGRSPSSWALLAAFAERLAPPYANKPTRPSRDRPCPVCELSIRVNFLILSINSLYCVSDNRNRKSEEHICRPAAASVWLAAAVIVGAQGAIPSQLRSV